MVAHILLDEPAAVVATDDGIGQVKILDHRLQRSAILLSHLASKNGRDLLGLANGAVGVE